MLNSGKLKHLIQFQIQNGPADEFGTANWQPLLTTRAQVEAVSATETEDSSQQLGVARYKIKCRYKPNITNKLRIKYNDQILNIVEPPINVKEQNRDLLISAEAVNNG